MKTWMAEILLLRKETKAKGAAEASEVLLDLLEAWSVNWTI